MENKIEIYQLAKYLPYGLNIKTDEYGVLKLNEIHVSGKYKFWCGGDSLLKFGLTGKGFSNKNLNPLIRPLSDLVVLDKTGVTDMERMAKIAGFKFDKCKVSHSKSTYGILFKYEFEQKRVFAYTSYCFSFGVHLRPEMEFELMENQLQLFDFLFSRHYDVYGWIEKGLALNIHDLNEKYGNS